ncbi:MAG: phosphoribosyl-AMP cyclohydrolase [Betaproteobacteria bacterium RIFCSPLOWO2_02_FULL_64_12]|nr:MAG: phosphoribosyl-AMP cyclohydrolase [Betaproteobacteria bacterium RIFCSPLOWO2_02_FULL_64_12]OGA56180.1 MAG: phosphoribosyl-AMP cyclohydrolase [Betaproteobacteria bacterium RIFCSPLOWO2_12_FULL_65_14]
MSWLDKVKWNADGLVPAIAQEAATERVLMVAWMNREALKATVETGQAVYWSRSRKRLWPKGEESGHVQRVLEVRLDCDEDVVLLRVEQVGGIACHTGRPSCFFQKYENGDWVVTDPVIKDPKEIYRK